MTRINKNMLYITYFVSIIILGSIGFYIIGGDDWSWLDSIYMTIITTLLAYNPFFCLYSLTLQINCKHTKNYMMHIIKTK